MRVGGWQQFLEVQLVKCHEKYIGLPSYIRRNKRALFSSIVDHVWEKIHGWKGRMLSVGGKEILVKTVVQFVPAYAMSLFILPNGLISEIEQMCARFWCGNTQEKRRIHWCFKQHMCLPEKRRWFGV